MPKRIVIASPNKRNDLAEENLANKLLDCELTRIRFKEELSIDRLRLLNPEIIFFPHWSWIIPREIHQNFKCIIFHMTDLPYGRGGSPLQNLIVTGHKETMLSALLCVDELDAGPIYLKRKLSLQGTAEAILVRAAEIIEEMIVEIVGNAITPVPQQGEPLIFKRRKPEDCNIIHLNELEKVYDYIRMLDADGYPPAFLETPFLRLEFNNADLTNDAVFTTVKITKKS